MFVQNVIQSKDGAESKLLTHYEYFDLVIELCETSFLESFDSSII